MTSRPQGRHRNTVVYRDMTVAQGTKLMDAIEVGDTKLSEKLYQQLRDQFHAHFPKEDWQRVRHNMMNTEDYFKYVK